MTATTINTNIINYIHKTDISTIECTLFLLDIMITICLFMTIFSGISQYLCISKPLKNTGDMLKLWTSFLSHDFFHSPTRKLVEKLLLYKIHNVGNSAIGVIASGSRQV